VAFCAPEEKPLLEAIEDYTGAQVAIIQLDRNVYQDTLDFSAEAHSDWKTLIAQHEAEMAEFEKKTKKKKGKQ
jgi:ATP-dependent RNA helicase RhlE